MRVWADLEALGDAVREKRDFVDAPAVANETMKRVRHNAEVVVARLESAINLNPMPIVLETCLRGCSRA